MITASIVLGTLLAACDATAPTVALTSVNSIQVPARVKVDLDIRPHSAWTDARRDKAQAAARALETVLNSVQFSRSLEIRSDLLRSEGLSAAAIVRIIRSGKTLAYVREEVAKWAKVVKAAGVRLD